MKTQIRKIWMCLCISLWSVFACAAYQGVPYLNGGVGDDERAQMTMQQKDFALKLVFAAKSGAYVATVDTIIFDDKGQQVFALKSAGPFLLVQLPPAHYRVQAIFEGAMVEKNVTIASSTQSELMFRW